MEDQRILTRRLGLLNKRDEAFALYRWFLPLLRMDTVPKFIQLIHHVQAETGTGNARVRPPRLELTGTELDDMSAAVQQALAHRPQARSTPFPSA